MSQGFHRAASASEPRAAKSSPVFAEILLSPGLRPPEGFHRNVLRSGFSARIKVPKLEKLGRKGQGCSTDKGGRRGSLQCLQGITSSSESGAVKTAAGEEAWPTKVTLTGKGWGSDLQTPC